MCESESVRGLGWARADSAGAKWAASGGGRAASSPRRCVSLVYSEAKSGAERQLAAEPDTPK